MINLFILVESVTTVMAEGYDSIRVYTGATEDGAFTTLDGTVTLVALTESYTYTDSDGTNAIWYKTCYYSAANGNSDLSTARKGETSSAYATVKELRQHIGMTGETDDWELAQILDGTARTINRYCNRPEGFVGLVNGSIRYYTGHGKGFLWIDECVAVSAVSVKDSPSDDEDSYTSWTVGTVGTTTSADVFAASGSPSRPDFNATPYTMLIIGINGDYSSFPYGAYSGRGVPTVAVTARWGYATSPPDDIRLANLAWAARLYKRLQSAMADTAGSTEMGTLFYRQALDPDIKTMLEGGRYVKPAIGVRV